MFLKIASLIKSAIRDFVLDFYYFTTHMTTITPLSTVQIITTAVQLTQHQQQAALFTCYFSSCVVVYLVISSVASFVSFVHLFKHTITTIITIDNEDLFEYLIFLRCTTKVLTINRQLHLLDNVLFSSSARHLNILQIHKLKGL